MRKAITFIIVAGAAATAACGRGDDGDPGAIVSRTFAVGNFTEVEVAGPLDVNIQTGDNPGVSARGNEKLLERLEVEVKGNTLIIRPRRNRGWFGGGNWTGNRGSGTIAVTVPMIRAATLAGAGDLTINAIRGEQFEGQIAGSGDLRIGTVEVERLTLGIAGSGDARADTGRAQRAEYEIAGAGGVDAKGVRVERLEISIAGSGSIRAHATGTADVDIVGAGNVEVTGGAKCSVSKAGSGNVNCS